MDNAAEPATRPDGPAPASATACGRCGDYARLRMHWGRNWCDACMARRDPIELEPATIGNLMRHSVALATTTFKPAIALSFIVSLPPALLASTGHPVRTSLAYMVWSLTLGLLARSALRRLAFLTVVSAKPPTLTRVSQHALRCYARVMGTTIQASVEAGVLFLLLVVPGVLRMLSYAASTSVAVNEQTTPDQALSISKTLMTGHRFDTFAAAAMLWLPVVVIAGAQGWLQSKLGWHADQPFPIGQVMSAGLSCVFGLPVEMLGVVLHLKLSQARVQIT